MTHRYPVTSYAATDRPLSAESLEKVFRRSGDQSFTLRALHTGTLPAVVVPPSELNAVRREFYGAIAGALGAGQTRTRSEHLRQAQAELLPPHRSALRPSRSSALAWARRATCTCCAIPGR